MLAKGVVCACLAGAALAPARTPSDLSAYREPLERILREGLRTCTAHELLLDLCRTAPHRLSGSSGAADAVKWAKQALERAGLENVRLEPCSVPFWERGSTAELALAGADGSVSAASERLAIAALGPSVPTPVEGLTAEVVEVHDFEELRALGDSARGKIVFFNRSMDASLADTFEAYGKAVDQRWGGAREAAKAGGIAAIVRSMTTRLDDLPHTGSMGYEEGVPKVPAVAISTHGAERLAARLKKAPVRARLRLDCRQHEDQPSFNVVGELPGSELASEVLVVGGHLDAWDLAEGATDDGAGCAQSIEAVRLIKALGLKPKRTLRVVLFMNEENGLRGAKAYAESHKDELEQHVLAMESDRGGFTPRGFESDASPEGLELLRAAAELLSPIGIGFVRPGSGGADVGPLGRAGVPTIGYVPDCQRYFDIHHCERDTVAQVSPRELELGAISMAGMLYVVADVPERLPRAAASK
jgi:carboxypeptidase Q